MILGAMDQKLWVFEVFRRSMGMAGMCPGGGEGARVSNNRWQLKKKWI
jgi:hypothetical protein